jgi:hypothetical protein
MNMREAKEGERFGLPFSALLPVSGREPAEPSRVRSSSAYVLRLPDTSQGIFRSGRTRISRFPRKVLRCVLGVCDRAELGNASR